MEELPVLECRLDDAGLRAQRDRYRAIGAAAVRVERAPARLVAELGEDVDGELVAEAIAVERECCPFFDLGYDAAARRLTVAVASVEHEPALDAIEHALRAG